MNARGFETLRDIAQNNWMRTDMLNKSAEGFSGIVLSHVTTGSSVDRQDAEGYNALIVACQNGHLETVNILLENGADPDASTAEGVTALMLASQENRLDVVHVLLGNSVDGQLREGDDGKGEINGEDTNEEKEPLVSVNARAANGCPALSFAAKYGNIQVVQALLAAGADRNLGHYNGELPFMTAAANGHLRVCDLLLMDDGGDDLLVNHKRDDGMTALLCAAQGGHHEVITLLLRKGADLRAVRNDGSSALDLAISRRHIEAEKVLSENLSLGVIREKRVVAVVKEAEEFEYE